MENPLGGDGISSVELVEPRMTVVLATGGRLKPSLVTLSSAVEVKALMEEKSRATMSTIDCMLTAVGDEGMVQIMQRNVYDEISPHTLLSARGERSCYRH